MSYKLHEETKKNISYSTIKRILYGEKIFAFTPIKKPLLSKKNIASRFEICKIFLGMPDEQIQKIIFSDECKFNLFYSDGKVSVWREPGTGLQMQNLTPTIKFGGGSVMAWGCFSYRGIGKLVFIDGKMDSAAYVRILANNLGPSATVMDLENFYLSTG
jgi:hypothetical protein